MHKLILFIFLFVSTNIVYSKEVEKDIIVAIVNDEVILRSDINKEIAKIVNSDEVKKFANLNEKQVFDKILEKMILDSLLIQATKKFGITISDIAVENSLRKIAENQKITVSQLRANLIKSGRDYQDYVETLRNKMAVDELFRAQFYSGVRISDDEIENFLKNEKIDSSQTTEYDISEFVILDETKIISKNFINKVYADLIKTGLQETKKKYNELEIEINDYGKTKINILPDIFVESLKNLDNSEYTKIIESSRGYHILKLNNVINKSQIFSNEYKVRHILMTSDLMTTEDEVREKLSILRNEIKDLDGFIKSAKQYSADKASAVKGGDLGWVRKNSLVKEFADAMMLTPIEKISDPFKTRFGWHILYVENIRSVDDTFALMKKRAEHQIRVNRAQRERESWVSKLREQAYIEIKEF